MVWYGRGCCCKCNYCIYRAVDANATTAFAGLELKMQLLYSIYGAAVENATTVFTGLLLKMQLLYLRGCSCKCYFLEFVVLPTI